MFLLVKIVEIFVEEKIFLKAECVKGIDWDVPFTK